MTEPSFSEPSFSEIVERHRKRLMAIPEVTGVAVGLSPQDSTRKCVLVYVTSQQRPEGVPEELDGAPVEIVRTRGFQAL